MPKPIVLSAGFVLLCMAALLAGFSALATIVICVAIAVFMVVIIPSVKNMAVLSLDALCVPINICPPQFTASNAILCLSHS